MTDLSSPAVSQAVARIADERAAEAMSAPSLVTLDATESLVQAALRLRDCTDIDSPEWWDAYQGLGDAADLMRGAQ